MHGLGIGKGPKVFGTVIFILSGHQESRIFLLKGQLQIRIGFIILQHDIVSRPIQLDKITLQQQRFGRRIYQNIL